MTEFFIPDDFDFGQQFDRVTLTRAMALDPERAMLSMHIDGPALLTRQRGSVNAFEQRIELPVNRHLGLQVRGQCSCPVGFNCPHVAAALMAFEAFQIRRSRDPSLTLTPPLAAAWQLASASTALVPPAPELPAVWLRWLGDVPPPLAEAPPAPAAPTQQLMYALQLVGARLQLQFRLAALRRGGEPGVWRPHGGTAADLLRLRPGYLDADDVAVLVALLPLAVPQAAGTTVLHGGTAETVLRAMLATGRARLLDADAEAPDLPPATPARWHDEPLSIALRWRGDTAGRWRTEWQRTDGRTQPLAWLPEPHAVDCGAATIGPAQAQGASLDVLAADWLARMPPVPSELLGVVAHRLQRVAADRGVELPLPDTRAREVRELGDLALQPVLRLTACGDVAFEGAPPELGDAATASAANAATTASAANASAFGAAATAVARSGARQAAVQLVLRYATPGDAAIDFHFPAGAAAVAFIDAPDSPTWLRFQRDAAAEADALATLARRLELRAWSRSASLALDRIARLRAGRAQASAVPQALEGEPLMFVPRRRDAWPLILARGVPALEAEGWQVEHAADFPFETVAVDAWQLDVDEAPGSPWFEVGIRVSVDGRALDLLPLLVSLVQSGWLRPDAEPREAAAEGDGAGAGTAGPAGDVLLPWPGEADGSTSSRQRLLRLPRQRVEPLIEWLRGTFKAGDKPGRARVSRFDVDTLEALATLPSAHDAPDAADENPDAEAGASAATTAAASITAPAAFTELIDQVRALRSAAGLPPVAPSPGVCATLRPYQLDGLAWMDFMRRARLGGVLADDMGLGKTLQTLAWLHGELDAGRLDRPALVVVPTSLIGNWQTEAARFTPALELLVLHGPARAERFERIPGAHVVVTSYPLAVRDIAVLAQHEWHVLVLDEAQRIKNSRSQAAVALKTLRSRHRLCLSGTPLENHLGELWSLLDFACPGLLGSDAQFRDHYRHPIERRHDASAAGRLARRVRPLILRRTKLQVARDLPEKTETLLRVELAGGQADLYETVRASMNATLREAIRHQGLAKSRIMVLDALLKLRQVCCDPRLLKTAGLARPAPSAKMELLLELLPTLVEDGRRVLIFSQFTEMLALIEPELARLKLPHLKLTGESRDRDQIVAAFQRGDVPLFLISLKAGGVGLNLTAADTVILYDPWWNPAVEQQAIDRAYRIGQDKPVFVYKLVASGTVEERMLELQAKKAGLVDALLSGVASDAALDADDFEALFQPLASEDAGAGAPPAAHVDADVDADFDAGADPRAAADGRSR